MTETERNDARRGQLMGAAWLNRWIEQGRGRGKGNAASWISSIEVNEEPKYSWIWVQPYLDKETDVDEYRGQQAGKLLLARFAEGVDLQASQFWFDKAKKESEKTDEQWLFLDPILEVDGWRKTKTEDGKPAWTRAG